MPTRHYYQARPEFVDFIDALDGSYEEFARKAGCNGRTIGRLRSGGRLNRKTANSILKAALDLGWTQPREKTFDELADTAKGGKQT